MESGRACVVTCTQWRLEGIETGKAVALQLCALPSTHVGASSKGSVSGSEGHDIVLGIALHHLAAIEQDVLDLPTESKKKMQANMTFPQNGDCIVCCICCPWVQYTILYMREFARGSKV